MEARGASGSAVGLVERQRLERTGRFSGSRVTVPERASRPFCGEKRNSSLRRGCAAREGQTGPAGAARPVQVGVGAPVDGHDEPLGELDFRQLNLIVVAIDNLDVLLRVNHQNLSCAPRKMSTSAQFAATARLHCHRSYVGDFAGFNARSTKIKFHRRRRNVRRDARAVVQDQRAVAIAHEVFRRRHVVLDRPLWLHVRAQRLPVPR